MDRLPVKIKGFWQKVKKDDEFALKCFSYLSSVIAFIFFIVIAIKDGIGNAFLNTVLFVVILLLLWYFLRFNLDKRHKKDTITFTRVIAEIVAVPILCAVVVFIMYVLLIDSRFGIKNGKWLALSFTISILSIVTIVTLGYLYRRRKDHNYLGKVRVLIDDTEALYWILLSVVLYLSFSDLLHPHSSNISKEVRDQSNQEMIKLLILPFMVQTRIVKAVVGHLLYKPPTPAEKSEIKPIPDPEQMDSAGEDLAQDETINNKEECKSNAAE